jgi:hypothetical protein
MSASFLRVALKYRIFICREMAAIGELSIQTNEPHSNQGGSSSISEASGVHRQPVDELYRLSFNTVVKPYKNAQNRTGESLGVVNINVSSLEAFRSEVSKLAFDNVEGVAIANESGFFLRPEQVSVLLSSRSESHAH